ALNQRLDLLIRNQSLADVLAQIDAAVEPAIEILPGSLEDAATLLAVDAPHVAYLDLRGATVADALDWALQPNRLSWWVEDGIIRIASARRQAGAAPWIYDLGRIVLPLP